MTDTAAVVAQLRVLEQLTRTENRIARLRTVQPEAEALAAKVARLAGETDRKIAALEAEYQRNKEPVLQLLMQIVMSIDNPHAERK